MTNKEDVFNKVKEKAEAKGDVRYPTRVGDAQTIEDLKNILEAILIILDEK